MSNSDEVFEIGQQGKATVVRLKMPQIDMFNVTDLIEEMKPVIDRRPSHIVLDMQETSFIDSSGMGGLIRIHQQIKDFEGNFYITGLNSKVANLMRLTRSTRYLQCFDSMKEALSAVENPPTTGD